MIAGTYLSGSSLSSPSYCSRSVRARKKMIAVATARKPTTDTMAIPTTRGSETYSSQCFPRYHQFSPTRHLQPRSDTNMHTSHIHTRELSGAAVVQENSGDQISITAADLQMAPLPGIMSHLPSLRQKSSCSWQTLMHGSPSTLR